MPLDLKDHGGIARLTSALSDRHKNLDISAPFESGGGFDLGEAVRICFERGVRFCRALPMQAPHAAARRPNRSVALSQQNTLTTLTVNVLCQQDRHNIFFLPKTEVGNQVLHRLSEK